MKKIDYSKLPTIKGKIDGKTYELLVMTTEDEKEYGAMGISELDDNEGLYFDYREDPQEECGFWMKDTEVALDVIFLDEDGEVLSVHEGKPLDETPMVERNVYAVLEVAAGSGIEEGDVLELIDNQELEPNKMYVIGSDGNPQAELKGGERIVSRKETRVLIRKAKKAFETKNDSDYKALGKYMFMILEGQDSRDPQYVEAKNPDSE